MTMTPPFTALAKHGDKALAPAAGAVPGRQS